MVPIIKIKFCLTKSEITLSLKPQLHTQFNPTLIRLSSFVAIALSFYNLCICLFINVFR